MEVAFPPVVVTSLAEIFAGLGWRQFHVAETEKYAHVTYFFNGGVGGALAGRGARAGAQPQGRDLRPPAGDERGGRHGRAGAGDRGRHVRLHRGQLTPTRTWSATPASGTRRSEACEVRRRVPRAGGGCDACRDRRSVEPAGRARCCASPPTTAMPTRCWTRRATPVTAHSLNPVPVRAGGRRQRSGCASTTACSPTSRRRSSSSSTCHRPQA